MLGFLWYETTFACDKNFEYDSAILMCKVRKNTSVRQERNAVKSYMKIGFKLTSHFAWDNEWPLWILFSEYFIDACFLYLI